MRATSFDTATVTVAGNGVALGAGVVEATTLTATVPASFLATAGTAVITLIDAVNGPSEPFTFTILNPAPVIDTVLPDVSVAGAPFTVTLSGSGFVSDTQVALNAAPLSVVEQTTTTLTVISPSETFTTPGAYTLTASNAAPGGGVASAPYTITQGPPFALGMRAEPGSLSADGVSRSTATLPVAIHRYPPLNNHTLCAALFVNPPATLDQAPDNTFNVYLFRATSASYDITIHNYPLTATGNLLLRRITSDSCSATGTMSVAPATNTVIAPQATFVWPVRGQLAAGSEYVLIVYTFTGLSANEYTLTIAPRWPARRTRPHMPIFNRWCSRPGMWQSWPRLASSSSPMNAIRPGSRATPVNARCATQRAPHQMSESAPAGIISHPPTAATRLRRSSAH